jgi:protein-S-isoprenylcysteine O-methyltransferase Ste14
LVGRPVNTVPRVSPITRPVASADVSAPDSAPDRTGTDDAPWPVMRRASTRFVRICRALAVVALGYGLYVVLLALRDLGSSAWLWVAIVVGALVHLAGVVGLWFLPPRSPSRLLPRPGTPGAGTTAARASARKALLAHEDLDADGRRLVALEVAANARLPLVAAAAFAILGPVAIGTPNTAHPLPWLGPVVAVLVLAVLVVLGLQVRAVRRLHRAAQRADALPTNDDDGSRYTSDLL